MHIYCACNIGGGVYLQKTTLEENTHFTTMWRIRVSLYACLPGMQPEGIKIRFLPISSSHTHTHTHTHTHARTHARVPPLTLLKKKSFFWFVFFPFGLRYLGFWYQAHCSLSSNPCTIRYNKGQKLCAPKLTDADYTWQLEINPINYKDRVIIYKTHITWSVLHTWQSLPKVTVP
jgi:hypothetical protein